jgi:ribose-phosphate pyrophosphokinase
MSSPDFKTALIESSIISDITDQETFGVLSGPAVERLEKSSISRVVLTNTLPLASDKVFSKLEVLSVAKIIAEALSAVFDETSVSDLFGGENQS